MTLPIAQLAKLLPLLGSNQVGEQLATLDAINRIMKNNESDWHDVVKALNGHNSGQTHAKKSDYQAPKQGHTANAVWDQMPFDNKLKWINLLLKFITNPWEQGFLADTLDRMNQYKERTRFSPKQIAIIERMIDAVTKMGFTI